MLFSWSLLLCIGLTAGCEEPHSTVGDNNADNLKKLSADVETSVVTFCGDCHRLPDPGSFPKEAWRAEVLRGFGFYYASGRSDLAMPVQADAIEYFVSRAPDQIELAEAEPVDATLHALFDVDPLVVPGLEQAAVSFIEVIELGMPLGKCIVFSDMRDGGIYVCPIKDGVPTSALQVGSLRHPATVRVHDWDQDGLSDLIIADLGAFLPSDTKLGGVVCLRQIPEKPGEYEQITLVDQVGRVSAVEIADFNRDGKEDLLVAEFGWHETGSITWFERGDKPWDPLVAHPVDRRPGTIHLPVVDINADGAPDFVALLSQHHEEIRAFVNDGHGNFQSQLIFAAPDPSYGSSGIELADINADGRWDIVYTNGDSFDSFTLKPFHAVRWFENLGNGAFKQQPLGPLPGAHRAVAGDVNGDGKMDIVAGAFLPRDVIASAAEQAPESLVVWLQDGGGGFTKHVLEVKACLHAAIAAEDIDGDGAAEILVGNFRDGGVASGPPLEIYRFRRSKINP